MSSISLSRALVLSGSALALCLTIVDQAAAQSQGDVQIRPAAQSAIDSLDSLEQLLLAPPEEQNRLNVYVTPQYRHERYEEYSEQGQFFSSNGGVGPVDIEAPDFTADSTGISVGADYVLDSQWLIGGQLNYTETDFDYDVPPESDFLVPTTAGDVNNGLFFGNPTDRAFDEYGLSISTGYLSEPWTTLLTFGYSHRDIETETRKVGLRNLTTNQAGELHVLEADFESDTYSVDLGGSYRWQSGETSLQPYASIGYQIEDVDGYSEELTSKRTRLLAAGGGLTDDFFTLDPRVPFVDPTTLNPVAANASAKVDDQTIRSIPGQIGVLFTTPLTHNEFGSDVTDTSVWRLRTGLSFTHDFSDQKRNIRTLRQDSRESAVYEEENRNRNFFSLTAALGYNFSAVNGSLSYQRDIGLDERKSADILSLQLRVPL